MTVHAETLSLEQRAVLRQLGPIAQELGFYLGGGTAIAIQLGHRQSVDLDWFTGQRIDAPIELAKRIQDRGVALQIGAVARGTLHGTVAGVRVSFFEFAYVMLQPLIHWPEFDCPIASLDDLAAMKLLAISQRGSKKDFLDVYALGMHGLSLDAMLNFHRSKFAIEDVSRVTYSLCYFDDAESERMPKMVMEVTWEQAKAAIREWVKSLAE